MTLQESGITKKKTEEILVASLRFRTRGSYRDFEVKNVPSMFEKLFEKCKDHVFGSGVTVFDHGVYSDGLEVEICFPVTQPIETGEVRSRILESVEVLSLTNNGPYEKKRGSYRKLYGYLREHGIQGTSIRREINLKFNPDNPEENTTELQVVLHRWDKRFAKNLDRVLGSDARKKIMQGSDKLFNLESTSDERVKWINAAMERLNELADEEQKYDILSSCANEFSQKRIAKLRAIYEQNQDVNEVIKAMYEDPAWYENPRREGNIIYVTKIPYDSENYRKAKDKDEKKKHYCHWTIVRNHLNDGISPTFCTCATGWYRQIWGGILRKPVKVELQKSLTKGNDTCEFVIHLPLDDK